MLSPKLTFKYFASPSATLRITEVFPLEGGLPLIYQDEVVGGIGISGVKSHQDGLIAQAGAAAL